MESNTKSKSQFILPMKKKNSKGRVRAPRLTQGKAREHRTNYTKMGFLYPLQPAVSSGPMRAPAKHPRFYKPLESKTHFSFGTWTICFHVGIC